MFISESILLVKKNELLNHLIEMKAQYNACSSTSTMPIFCISKDNLSLDF